MHSVIKVCCFLCSLRQGDLRLNSKTDSLLYIKGRTEETKIKESPFCLLPPMYMPLGGVDANLVTCSQSLPWVKVSTTQHTTHHTHTHMLQGTAGWLRVAGTMSDFSRHLLGRGRTQVINRRMSSEGCSDWFRSVNCYYYWVLAVIWPRFSIVIWVARRGRCEMNADRFRISYLEWNYFCRLQYSTLCKWSAWWLDN